jgi:hypothetical protein
MRIAILVVGHENFGKTHNLKKLTDDSSPRWFELFGRNFFLRRGSNDDAWFEYKKMIEKLDPKKKPDIILAFCPKFGDDTKKHIAGFVIKALKAKGYKLFFWVIKHRFKNPEETVTDAEIKRLESHGVVEVFKKINPSPLAGAEDLRKFIKAALR